MTRLLIADDHPIVREGLKRIIQATPDLRVVSEAADSREALEACRHGGIDVVLLDLSMPGRGAFDLLRQIRTECPKLRVLVLSMHAEDQYAVRALRAGASGYLTKDHAPDVLAEAIRRVARGGRYISGSLAESLAFGLGPDTEQPVHDALSDREYQVFEMLASGKSLKEIGAVLSVSPKTVSTYRARILEKLHLASNAALVRYAVERSLFS